MDFRQLQHEVRDVGARVGAMLRAEAGGDRAVKGLDWTIGELGAHLVTVARRNLAVATGESVAWEPGDSPRAAMAAFNDEEIEALDEHEPVVLADLLLRDAAAVLEAYGDDPDRPVAWPRWEANVRESLGVWLGELLVHGRDLARTVGHRWPIRPDQAIAIFDGLMPALPVYVNKAKASRAAGMYHIHLRGDGDYAVDVRADATVTARREKPDAADLHVSADPVAYLLVGYGRASRWRAIGAGQIVAWGKPGLALRFPDLFERP